LIDSREEQQSNAFDLMCDNSEPVSNEKKLMKVNCNMKNNMKKEFEDEDEDEDDEEL
jgi:hypothetical protein